MTSPRQVLDQILETITPASGAQAEAARQRIGARTGPRESLGALEGLAERLAGARHAPRPAVARKVIAVCAADHGVADPGIDLGMHSSSIVALDLVSSGGAAVNAAARSVGARVMPIDCGVRGGEHAFDAGVLALRICDGT
ncbi:MAG TPA: nicotinate-nucleotide--dimethylbenzimidazole phosphoribosyltransferase, partial [Kofleriaceae bacterium]|nr:nicotinate-nucleotide--dimethylbenzimidazole phosphoribosyltransferase [Kofleriaceae bacterium]